LWDLFSREAVMLENTWNVSIRLMFDLPIQTHTWYIEPISESSHVKIILIKRFLTFVQALKSSPKLILTNLLKMISKDVQSVTGSNLRKILLLVNKSDVDDLVPEDSSKIQYRPEDEENTWKIRMVKELIEVRNGTLQVDNFNEDEIKEVLDSLCVD
jgi:hypothetical protein